MQLNQQKNTDIDVYKHSGYGIGFDRKLLFSLGDGFGRICIIFGVDMSSSVHVDNKKKDILSFGEGPAQGLNGTILTAEKRYLVNFTENNNKFCLSLQIVIYLLLVSNLLNSNQNFLKLLQLHYV